MSDTRTTRRTPRRAAAYAAAARMRSRETAARAAHPQGHEFRPRDGGPQTGDMLRSLDGGLEAILVDEDDACPGVYAAVFCRTRPIHGKEGKTWRGFVAAPSRWVRL